MSPLEFDYKMHMIGKTDAEWVSLNEILGSEAFISEQITTSLSRDKRTRKMSTDSGRYRIGLLAQHDEDAEDDSPDDLMANGNYSDQTVETFFLKSDEKRGNVIQRFLNDSWVFKAVSTGLLAIKNSLRDGALYYEE